MSSSVKLTVLVLVCSCVPINAAHVDSHPMCSVEWEADWDDVLDLSDIELYPRKGEIITGVTVRDVLQEAGLAWNAPSFLEITGLLCVRYGPLLNSLASESGVENVDQVRTECETVFKSLQQGEELSMDETCNTISNEQEIGDYLDDPLYVVDTGDEYLNEFQTIENLSPIAFELLDWLGPSPFSGDLFGLCSAGRLLLGMSIDGIIDRIQDILVNPLVSLLEFLGDNRICVDENDFLIQLIDVFSNTNERPFCQFLSSNPTDDAFIDRARNILDNIEGVLTDPSICINALATLNTFEGDQTQDIFYNVTGEDLTTPSSRWDLCNRVSDSFSATSRYVPSPYYLPAGQNLTTFYFDSTPGEILPEFYFEDALDVSGAFLRSDTLAEGLVVLCTVFETLLTEEFPEVAGDIAVICNSLGSSNFAAIEAKCRDMTVSLMYQSYRSKYMYYYYESAEYPPTSVRVPTVFYVIAIGVEYGRQLLDLERISQADACLALDRFYQSDHNLQSVIRLAVDVTLAEFLPIAHDICEDYDNIIDYYQARFEKYGNGRVAFFALERDITKAITAHFGYERRQDLCDAIADGIDPVSGRASDDSVTQFEQELFAFLTDDQRCGASVNAASDLISLAIEERNIDDEFEYYTGYGSVGDLCSALSDFFTTNLCESSGGSSVRSHLQSLLAGIAVFVIMIALV